MYIAAVVLMLVVLGRYLRTTTGSLGNGCQYIIRQ